MIGYLIAWPIYVLSVLAMLYLYHVNLAKYLPQAWRPILLVLAACVLLTPWPIDNQVWLPAPAIIATLFHVMSGAALEAIKSLLPIFLVTTIACLAMWFKQRHQQD
ncbi:MAG TPA: hypothetical protein PLJ88_01995 [Agitococcus sp.]|nr:hypothetical protein [Agitococcus sp.]